MTQVVASGTSRVAITVAACIAAALGPLKHAKAGDAVRKNAYPSLACKNWMYPGFKTKNSPINWSPNSKQLSYVVNTRLRYIWSGR